MATLFENIVLICPEDNAHDKTVIDISGARHNESCQNL